MTFATVPHELHRNRRAAINPFFSKKSIAEYAPIIQSVVDRFCTRLGAATQTEVLLNLKYAYAAVTTDVINEYCFSRTHNAVLAPDFNIDTYKSMYAWTNMCHVVSGVSISDIVSNVDRRSSNKCHGFWASCNRYRYNHTVHGPLSYFLLIETRLGS